MSQDREERRQRSQRNKIVTMLGGITAASVAIEQGAPSTIPAGTSIIVAQITSLLGLAVNLWWPR